MRLIFNEIVSSPIVIDEDTFKEYLDSCKEDNVTPDRTDFLDWITGNFFISEFIDERGQDIEYDLTVKQFNEYLEQYD